MILLLSTLANIEVGDLYPVYSDTRTGAMLSRIKFISNETFRNFEGKLSGYTFNKYWDDIGQVNYYFIYFVYLLGFFFGRSCVSICGRNVKPKSILSILSVLLQSSFLTTQVIDWILRQLI